MWARFLVDLLRHWPSTSTSVRALDRGHERAADAQGRRRDRRPAPRPAPQSTGSPPQLQAGEIPLVGRTEAEVSADLGARILAEGHQRVNFAIVAAGENAAIARTTTPAIA